MPIAAYPRKKYIAINSPILNIRQSIIYSLYAKALDAVISRGRKIEIQPRSPIYSERFISA